MRLLGIALVALLAVEASASTRLREEQRVKVRGQFAAQRVQAESVRLKDAEDRDLEIVGRVEALDDAGRIRIHGIWAVVEERELDRRARQWFRRLEAGDWIKVEGDWQPSGRFVVDSMERPKRERRVDAVEGMVWDLTSNPGGGTGFRVGPFSVDSASTTSWRGFE